MFRTTATRLGLVVSWPATLAHELTHMLLALPWAVESAIIVDDRGAAHYVTWRAGTPRWAIVLASLGPTFVGSLVGLLGIWRLLTAPPESARGLLLAAAIAGYWVIYVAPSADDLDIQEPEQNQSPSNQGD